MNEQKSKITNHSENLQCANCKKVLAKLFQDGHFEIKCPRCETINVVSGGGVLKKP